jgi:hypothetical protein
MVTWYGNRKMEKGKWKKDMGNRYEFKFTGGIVVIVDHFARYQ